LWIPGGPVMKMIAVAATLVALTGATAQAQDAVGTGATPMVRVHLRSQSTVQGFLRGNSVDELVVFTSDGQYRHVPLAAVQRFEVRRRTGSHVKRGALMGVFLWASLMFAASIDSLEDAGAASWQSAAVLAGSVGVGAAIGKTVPRYGWVASEPGRLSGSLDPPLVRFSVRF
jgi:hypothetical protein